MSAGAKQLVRAAPPGSGRRYGRGAAAALHAGGNEWRIYLSPGQPPSRIRARADSHKRTARLQGISLEPKRGRTAERVRASLAGPAQQDSAFHYKAGPRPRCVLEGSLQPIPVLRVRRYFLT